MDIKYTYHEGSQAEKPLEVDTISSSTVVYLRKNIKQVVKEDEQTRESVTLWGYDEAELTQDEYTAYLARLNSAQIDDTVLTLADMLVDITLLQLGF